MKVRGACPARPRRQRLKIQQHTDGNVGIPVDRPLSAMILNRFSTAVFGENQQVPRPYHVSSLEESSCTDEGEEHGPDTQLQLQSHLFPVLTARLSSSSVARKCCSKKLHPKPRGTCAIDIHHA